VIAMTKHTDLEVIISNAAALPALIKNIFADWKTFRLLMKEADYLADEYDKYGRILDELESYDPTGRETAAPSADDLRLDGHMKNKIARCGARLDKIDRDDLYDIDEHGDRVLKKTVIAERLAMMLSTLVGEPSNPKAALAMMLQHIFDAEISYPALESGCRDIEAGPKPYAHRNPGEFLKVFTAEEERWRRRREAISGLEELVEYVLTFIPEAQARFALAQARFVLAQAKDKAKSAAYDLSNATSWLERAETTVDAKQKAVDAANQELERAIAARTRAKQQFTDAVAIKQAADAALAALEQQGGKST
jgi:hypothetical protein